MKASVDEDLCTGCGLCEDTCPEVFEMEDGADTAVVIKENGGPEDLIQEAIDTCPVQCISWEED